MMAFAFRIATPQDKPFLYELHKAVSERIIISQFGVWDEDWQRKRFEENWTALTHQILTIDGKPVGILAVTEAVDARVLNNIELLPSYQSKGIGTAVISREIQIAKETRVPLRLQVLKHNVRARQLYERLGFRQTREDDHFDYLEWQDNH